MKKQGWLWALFGLYLAVLLRLTVFRDGFLEHGLFTGRVELAAFAYLAKLARAGRWRYFTYLFVGNLVWFAPMGAWARLRGRSFAVGLLWTFLLSLGVEVSQFVFGCGVSELDDLILNTLGGCLGWLATNFLCRRRRRKTTS